MPSFTLNFEGLLHPLRRPSPTPSYSLLVRYKYELHQAAYLFHLVACLHDISSLNCCQYPNSDHTTYYFSQKPPPNIIFPPMEPDFSMTFLKLCPSLRFLFCKLETCKTRYCIQFTFFTFHQHFLDYYLPMTSCEEIKKILH